MTILVCAMYQYVIWPHATYLTYGKLVYNACRLTMASVSADYNLHRINSRFMWLVIAVTEDTTEI